MSRTRIAGVVLLLVVIVLVVVFGVAPLLQRITRGPAWLAQSLTEGVTNQVGMLTPKRTLLTENAMLKNKIQEYEAQTLTLKQVQAEYEELRKELSYLPNPRTTITAQIIGKPGKSLFNTLILDQGERQGIQIGQLVTAHHTLGIGIVAAVSTDTATVELFGGPHFSGDVLLSTKNITVPAIGKGSGNFEMHIPREVAVADGDLLAFPENPHVIVGVVKSTLFDPRDPFQTVLARSPVNVQELRFVEVVK